MFCFLEGCDGDSVCKSVVLQCLSFGDFVDAVDVEGTYLYIGVR